MLLAAAVNYPLDEAAAMRERAHKLLLNIVASGQTSNMVQILLEKLAAPTAPAPAGSVSPGADAFKRAEKAFSSGTCQMRSGVPGGDGCRSEDV